MTRCLTYSIMQQRKFLKFETFVAPVDFNRKVQPVDIYDVFCKYYRINDTAKYIYSVVNTTNLITELVNGTSYRYGYELEGNAQTFNIDFNGTTLVTALPGGVPFDTVEVLSTDGFPDAGVVTLHVFAQLTYSKRFTYTSKDDTHFYGATTSHTWGINAGSAVNKTIEWGSSTKRWVIVNNTSMILQSCNMDALNGPEWLYCGPLINYVHVGSYSGGYASTTKYIHVHSLDNQRYTYGSCAYAPLTGLLHLSNVATTIGRGDNYAMTFYNSFLLDGVLEIPAQITRIEQYAFYGCNGLDEIHCYPLTAPWTSTNTFYWTTPIPLHIKSTGTSGYDVAPWTNTAIFSSIINDL